MHNGCLEVEKELNIGKVKKRNANTLKSLEENKYKKSLLI